MQNNPEKAQTGNQAEPQSNQWFGKPFAQTKESEGITPCKIEVTEYQHIPNMAPHWKFDLQNRVQAIRQAKVRGVFRGLSLFKKKSMPVEVSGEEILRWHPHLKLQKLAERLTQNPADNAARFQLAFGVSRKKGGLTAEVVRSLFLQSLTAASIGDYQLLGLKVTATLQVMYLNQLGNKSRHEVARIRSRLELFNEFNSSEREKYQLLKQIQDIESNMAAIKAHLRFGQKALKEQLPFTGAINLSESRAVLTTLDAPERVKQETLTKITSVIHVMKYIPLLHPRALQLADMLIEVLKDNPLGYQLKAKVLLGEYLLRAHTCEFIELKRPEMDALQSIYMEVYGLYEKAVNRVEKPANTPHERNILIEFAGSVNQFYKISSHILRKKPSAAWLDKALNEARMAVEACGENDKVQWLSAQIRGAMVEEGFLKK